MILWYRGYDSEGTKKLSFSRLANNSKSCFFIMDFPSLARAEADNLGFLLYYERYFMHIRFIKMLKCKDCTELFRVLRGDKLAELVDERSGVDRCRGCPALEEAMKKCHQTKS